MDLLKEEKKLIEKLVKAREAVERKGKYLAKCERSFVIAQRKVRAATTRVRKIRVQIRAQGVHLIVGLPTVNPPVVIHAPSVKPTPVEEENTD